MTTAMQTLWEWIDANYHEDNFNLNDARDMSIKLEKEQIIEAYNTGYEDATCNHINDAEQYYNQKYKQLL
jgi:hypothetical protein